MLCFTHLLQVAFVPTYFGEPYDCSLLVACFYDSIVPSGQYSSLYYLCMRMMVLARGSLLNVDPFIPSLIRPPFLLERLIHCPFCGLTDVL